jgi:hypothetical protein
MKKSFLLLGATGLLLSSCAVTHLEPGAENVIVTDKEHAPTSCKNLGQVSAFDTNGSSVTYTSHERLQKYQVNMLRNKTVDLGGNVLSIIDHETTYVDKHESDPDLVDTHFIQGTVYACSSAQLKNVVAYPGTSSDLTPKEDAED